MTSISSVGGSAFGANVSRTKRGEGPEQGLKRDLTDFLTAQGVSTDDQKSILSEIKSAIESTISSGSRPDPSQIQASVGKVLEQHGLSGSDFASQFPPPDHHGPRPSGPRPSGPPPSTSGTSSTDKTKDEQDTIQQLLEVLTKQAERNRIRTHHADGKLEASDSPNVTSTATTTASGTEAIANNIKSVYSSTSISSEIGALLSINA